MDRLMLLKEKFEAHRNEENALPMKKYMKDHFSFLGIKKPERALLMREFFLESEILKEELDHKLLLNLWEEEEREYQYAALDYLERSLKKLTDRDMPLMKRLILNKSWWDTVDMISPKAVGAIAQKYPHIIKTEIDEWAFGEHLWLRRAAILFQLKYKKATNKEILYRYILQNASSKEFFIQKAIGWALREYSKTNPQSVEKFLGAHTLPKLSVREGSKYVKSKSRI